MEKRPVVYKRRPRKPLSDLPPNESGVNDDPGSRLSSVVSADGDGKKPIIIEEKSRKSWIDRSLSNKGRRSSLSWGEEFNLSEMAYKWAGTLFGRKDKKPAVINRSKKVNPPIEFVREKQAMFAEIDSFELESEEESPAPKPRSQEWIKEYLDEPKDVLPRKFALEIVPEDEFEEFSDCLSAALLTPPFVSNHGHGQEVSSQSPSSQTTSSQTTSSQTTSSQPTSSYDDGTPGNPRLDSEDYSSPISSFFIDDPATDHRISNSEIPKARSDPSVGSDEQFPSAGANEKRQTLDPSWLVSRLKSLQIGEDGRVSGGRDNLNPLVEEDEEENSNVVENEGAKDTELFRQSGEILLETRAEDLLPIFEALLGECHQTQPLSLRDAIADFCDLAEMVKLGEGTFGEAFKGGGHVFKIVPMDGEILVNGEVQKTSAEIYSEVLLTNTLNRLRGLELQGSSKCANYCTNFIETKAIRICRGSYETELCLAWEEWDAIRNSENDHPMLFPQHQLYVVFVLADGGKDLETFVLTNFSEARSILLQVILALGVAEEGCGFEHRDLHWGNIVLARGKEHMYGHYRLLDEDIKVKTYGLSVSIIDFTLSRIDTGKHVFFCNLSADPGLFEGPSNDTQADTYRRMLGLTKGNWEGSFSQTNCYWIHYLADILLKKKSYQCSPQEKRALRSFCKRVLLYESAKAAVSDDFFQDMWIKS